MVIMFRNLLTIRKENFFFLKLLPLTANSSWNLHLPELNLITPQLIYFSGGAGVPMKTLWEVGWLLKEDDRRGYHCVHGHEVCSSFPNTYCSRKLVMTKMTRMSGLPEALAMRFANQGGRWPSYKDFKWGICLTIFLQTWTSPSPAD